MTASPPAAATFSRPLLVDDVPEDGLETSIEAASADCAAIAAALDLPSVAALAVSYRISRRPAGRLQVDGDLTARITQVCVVSLDPFESEVATEIDVTFAPPPRDPLDVGRDARRHGRGEPRHQARASVRRGPVDVRETPVVVGDDSDAPDPIVDGRIDLGALAVEFLALALDFYPKKPGVAFTDVSIGVTDEPKPSAFASLERLKDRS